MPSFSIHLAVAVKYCENNTVLDKENFIEEILIQI